jgi:hypothetical protein
VTSCVGGHGHWPAAEAGVGDTPAIACREVCESFMTSVNVRGGVGKLQAREWDVCVQLCGCGCPADTWVGVDVCGWLCTSSYS